MKITAAKFDGTDYLVEIDDAYGQNLCRDDLEIARMVLGDILDKRKAESGSEKSYGNQRRISQSRR